MQNNLKDLFLTYSYKNFQHKKQHIDTNFITDVYLNNFRQLNKTYIEKKDDKAIGLIGLKEFSFLTKLIQKKSYFLVHYLANNSNIYRTLLDKIFDTHCHELDLIISRQPIDNHIGINELIKRGFYYISGEAIFSRNIQNTTFPTLSDFKYIRPIKENDLPAIKTLANKYHKCNRYLRDPFFSTQTVNTLFNKTLENTYHQDNCQIFCYEKDNAILGYISVIKNTTLSKKNNLCYGSLDYIVVNPKYQQQGIGKVLNLYALSYLQKNKISIVSVKTLTDNYNAINLLQRSGFLITSQNIILHYIK